jgi:hypothetical protein
MVKIIELGPDRPKKEPKNKRPGRKRRWYNEG